MTVDHHRSIAVVIGLGLVRLLMNDDRNGVVMTTNPVAIEIDHDPDLHRSVDNRSLLTSPKPRT